MNKSELIESIADKANLSKADAGRALEAFIDSIGGSLAKGDTISIPGFGTFAVRQNKQRTGRNPQTGEQITIKASKSATFKAGKGLKDRLN